MYIDCHSPPPERVIFGEYPQTIATLDALEQMGDDPDPDGYYISAYDFERYAKITAAPHTSGYEFSSGEDVEAGEFFYFKVEPIVWRILEVNNQEASLLAERVLDARYFDAHDHHWDTSDVRNWLNDDFYNRAFYPADHGNIMATALDNQTTGYWSSTQYNTTDSIFLLTYKDITNDNYRFHPTCMNHDCERIGSATDYALASGVQINASAQHYGQAFWSARSPGGSNNQHTYVSSNGSVAFDSFVTYTAMGMRPALVVADIGKLDQYSALDIYFGRYPQTIASDQALMHMSPIPGPDYDYYYMYLSSPTGASTGFLMFMALPPASDPPFASIYNEMSMDCANLSGAIFTAPDVL